MMCVIKECRVQISFWFAVMLFLAIQTNTTAAASICAAFCHEISHITAILLLKEKIRAIRFTLIGAEIQREESASENKMKAFWISASGPIINILLAGIIHMACIENAESFLYANLVLGIVNLLPAFPLDGGVIMYTAFSGKFSEEKAYVYTERISFITLTIVGSIGFLMLFRSPYNYSLLALVVYSMIYLVNRNYGKWKCAAKESIRLHYKGN